MTDEEIIRSLFDRNEDGLNELIRKYGKTAEKIAFSVLKDRRDAEETVSDAYMALWNNIPPDRPAALCAYLYKTVRNLALKRLEAAMADKRKINSLASPIDELAEAVPSDFDVMDRISEQELGSYINAFLSDVKVPDRRIFVCRFFAGMEIGEIADRYGIGKSRVKMSLHRTKNKLREYLQDKGYYDEK